MPTSNDSMNQQAQAPIPIIAIEHAAEHVGGVVTIRGWLYNLRESGKLLFPIFRDGTGMIQGVVSLKEQPEAFAALQGLTQESSVIVTGKIHAEPRAPGGFEIADQRDRSGAARPGIESLSDPAQRARRRFSARSPAPLDSHAAPGCPSCAFARRPFAPRANYMDGQGYMLTDAPIFTPAACEGTTTLFEVQVHRRRESLPDAVRPALRRSHGHGARQGLHVRAHVSRRKIEDAPPPDRILDARAGGRLRAPGRHDGAGRGPGQPRRAVGGEESRARTRNDRPRYRQAREDRASISAHHLRRSGENPAEARQSREVGRRFRRRRRNHSFEAIRPAGDGASLSRGHEGVLHGSRTRSGPTWRWVSTCSLPKATAKSSAAASAVELRSASQAPARRTTCRKKRFSGISTCAATAACRTRASVWAWNAPWHGFAELSTSAK